MENSLLKYIWTDISVQLTLIILKFKDWFDKENQESIILFWLFLYLFLFESILSTS